MAFGASAVFEVVCDHPEANSPDEDLVAAGAGGVLSRVAGDVAKVDEVEAGFTTDLPRPLEGGDRRGR